MPEVVNDLVDCPLKEQLDVYGTIGEAWRRGATHVVWTLSKVTSKAAVDAAVGI